MIRSMAVYSAPVSSIEHAAMAWEVQTTLNRWIKESSKGVLIGGLALAFYTRPRHTTDVDILFLCKEDIPSSVPGFKRNRSGAYLDKETHVEVELTTSASFDLPEHVISKVFDTAVLQGGLRVASREGLIALKLITASASLRRRMGDLADVINLLENHLSIDMLSWELTKENLTDLDTCKAAHKP